jgi:hypothetical protein
MSIYNLFDDKSDNIIHTCFFGPFCFAAVDSQSYKKEKQSHTEPTKA